MPSARQPIFDCIPLSIGWKKRMSDSVFFNPLRFTAPFRTKKIGGTLSSKNGNLRHPYKQSTNKKAVEINSNMLFQYLVAPLAPPHSTLVGNYWSHSLTNTVEPFSQRTYNGFAMYACEYIVYTVKSELSYHHMLTSFWIPSFKFYNIELPLNNKQLSTTATKFGSQGSLDTG
jgi:hypothetical protein